MLPAHLLLPLFWGRGVHGPTPGPTTPKQPICTRVRVSYTMSGTVSVRLDKKALDEIVALSKELKSDRSEAVRRALDRGLDALRLERVLASLRKGTISKGRAAEVLGVSIYELLDLVEEHEIPYGYSAEDLHADLRRLGRRR